MRPFDPSRYLTAASGENVLGRDQGQGGDFAEDRAMSSGHGNAVLQWACEGSDTPTPPATQAQRRPRRSLAQFGLWHGQPNLQSIAREVPRKTAAKGGNCCPCEATAETFTRRFSRTRNHSSFTPGDAKVILLFKAFDPHLAGGIYQSSIFERVCRELVKEQGNVRNRVAPKRNIRAGYDNPAFDVLSCDKALSPRR